MSTSSGPLDYGTSRLTIALEIRWTCTIRVLMYVPKSVRILEECMNFSETSFFPS